MGLDNMVVVLLQSGKALAGQPMAITWEDREKFGAVRYGRLRAMLESWHPSAKTIIMRTISSQGELEYWVDGQILRRDLTDTGYGEEGGAYVVAVDIDYFTRLGRHDESR
ncbi:hypothetical protein HYU15_00905 [Candidatus Woesearchaeota archaeon]|nr:hypothetical protein [Candidatus Woesearchaeota archaeon]